MKTALACVLALLLVACGGSEQVQPERATVGPVDCGGGITCR